MMMMMMIMMLVQLPCRGFAYRAWTPKPTAHFDEWSRVRPTGLASVSLRYAPSYYFLPPWLCTLGKRQNPVSNLLPRISRIEQKSSSTIPALWRIECLVSSSKFHARLWETSQLMNEDHLTAQLWLFKKGEYIKFKTGGRWVYSVELASPTLLRYIVAVISLDSLEGSIELTNPFQRQKLNARPSVWQCGWPPCAFTLMYPCACIRACSGNKK